jgi:hypothetical protein
MGREIDPVKSVTGRTQLRGAKRKDTLKAFRIKPGGSCAAETLNLRSAAGGRTFNFNKEKNNTIVFPPQRVGSVSPFP